MLPFCSEETLDQLESNLASISSVTQMLNEGLTAQDITDKILNGLGASDEKSSLVPQYGPCEPESLKPRMIRAVASLGADEVKDIMLTEGKIEVCCEFCNEKYQFSEEEVLDYINS